MSVKLSKTSKLDGILSWSLQALDTCAGSIENGELVDACKGCYATTGFYRMPTVIDARAFNKEDWKRDEWVQEMIDAIGKDKYFRWFDSGDLYSVELGFKIVMVVRGTPDTMHWLPTRMGKFAKFGRVLRTLADMPNCTVRHSSDSVLGDTVDYPYGQSSTIVPEADKVKYTGFTVCEAYSRGGKCGDCRACWSKDVAIVAYPSHGATMKKVIRLLVEA